MNTIVIPGFERYIEALGEMIPSYLSRNELADPKNSVQDIRDRLNVQAVSKVMDQENRECVKLRIGVKFDAAYCDVDQDSTLEWYEDGDEISGDELVLRYQDAAMEEFESLFGSENGWLLDEDLASEYPDVAADYTETLDDIDLNLSDVEAYVDSEPESEMNPTGYLAVEIAGGTGEMIAYVTVCHAKQPRKEVLPEYGNEYDVTNEAYIDNDEDDIYGNQPVDERDWVLIDSKNVFDTYGDDCQLALFLDNFSGAYKVILNDPDLIDPEIDNALIWTHDRQKAQDFFDTYQDRDDNYDPDYSYADFELNEDLSEFVIQDKKRKDEFLARSWNVGSIHDAARFKSKEEAEKFLRDDDPRWLKSFNVVNIADI